MKKLTKLLILLTTATLSSCTFDFSFTLKPSGTTSSSSLEGTSMDDDSSSVSSSSSSSISTSANQDDSYTFRILATNDIHGTIYGDGDNTMNFDAAMTYIKNNNSDNTLILDQGDTWQGSAYSNLNYGEMMTKVMTYAGYDSRTVGNHDFDWGLEPIIHNTAAATYNDKTMTTLAANVYDYNFDTKIEGDTQRSDIGGTSYIKSLSSGLKVGVVGVIGSTQIKDISTAIVRDICFKNHIKTIKQEATKLREAGADFVICSIHGGKADVMDQGLASYIDLALCSHTHRYEIDDDSEGLQTVQFGSYGMMIGDISVTFNKKNRDKTFFITSHYQSEINDKKFDIDPTITEIMAPYLEAVEEEANEVVAPNATGYFSKSEELPNLMCKAIYKTAEATNYNIDLSMVNVGRASINKESWTYSDIYDAFPFDNKVYIVPIYGSDIKKELDYSSSFTYHEESISNLEDNTKYNVAILDFLFFHSNQYRYYDYFSRSLGDITDFNSLPCLENNYRQILRHYLLDNYSSTLLDASDFDSGLSSFLKS